MKNLRIAAFLPLIVGFLNGCAHARMTSIREPESAGKVFKRVLVAVPFADIESRNTAEKAFAEQIARYGAEGFPSVQVFTPPQKYPDQVALQTIQENGYDGVLLVNFSTAPPLEQSDPSGIDPLKGQVTAYGDAAWYSGNTYRHGEYYLAAPRVRFEIRLFDASTHKLAWVAAAVIPGNAFAKFGTLMDSLAEKAVKDLFKDGLLPLKASPF